MSTGSKVNVLVGTRKGGFIFTSDKSRKKWSVSDVMFKGWNMMHMVQDPRDQRLHASLTHFVFGSTTHYSEDMGKTWTQSPEPPKFTRPSKSGRPPGNPYKTFPPTRNPQ